MPMESICFAAQNFVSFCKTRATLSFEKHDWHLRRAKDKRLITFGDVAMPTTCHSPSAISYRDVPQQLLLISSPPVHDDLAPPEAASLGF